MAIAWVIRSGKYGERDSWALKHGCSGGGWAEVPDLSNVATREQVAQIVIDTYPGSDALIANYTGQLWALRGRVQPGDLLVMPMKTTKQIAIGRVTEGYEYLATEEDPNCRHVVRVDWQRRDLPRTAVKQDLLFTLGSAMSVFAPSKNNAVARLEHLLAHGTDPGQVPAAGNGGSKPAIVAAKDDAEAVDEPELATDIEEVAYDRITPGSPRTSPAITWRRWSPPFLRLTASNARNLRRALTAASTSSPAGESWVLTTRSWSR
jgi:restriction system protein